ncbi:MAG: hypothetical protein AB1489_27535 [Acidobacteriota bacterium]
MVVKIIFKLRVSIVLALLLLLACSGHHATALSYVNTQGAAETSDNDTTNDTLVINNNQATLPTNVIVPETLKPLLSKLLKQSSTFQQQCRQISNTTKLQITLIILPTRPQGYRSLSRITKYTDGRLSIRIEMVLMNDCIELIGHEFEHALEQVEGWNLSVMATIKGSRVYRQADGTFETMRAVHAGRAVSREFRNYRTPTYRHDQDLHFAQPNR